MNYPVTPKQLRALRRAKTMSTPQWRAIVEAVCEILPDDGKGLTPDEWQRRSIEHLGIDEHIFQNCRFHLIFRKRVTREGIDY
jgi:hypothetical protein